MTMTNEEIVRDYNQAANKSKQIKVLAELNCVSPGEIKALLAQAGVEGVEPPKRGTQRKTEAGASVPAAAEPGIYNRIETILAALPANAPDYAKKTAKELVVALFRQYMDQRLGKAVQDDA